MLYLSHHVQSVSKKSQIKSELFSRIAQSLEYEKNVMPYNYFVLSNFNYYPLIRMFSGKSLDNKISRIHKRDLRVLLEDYGSTFEELLQKISEQTIHTRNLQTLLLEAYKCLTSKNSYFLWDLFKRRATNYCLRIMDLVALPSTKTIRYGLNSLIVLYSIVLEHTPWHD